MSKCPQCGRFRQKEVDRQNYGLITWTCTNSKCIRYLHDIKYEDENPEHPEVKLAQGSQVNRRTNRNGEPQPATDAEGGK